jgi:hypothetical protein
MNLQLIGELVRLRYKLLWARTRSRNGRIALFITGYLLFVLVAILLSAGGFGAGMVAVRSGQAEKVAQIVLGALFLQAVLGTVIMGFGMNATFSDLELRRYPVTALERRITRHLIGIVDPFWFFILALELGLAVGLYAMGTSSFWLGITAVLLLFVCNYLFARAFGALVDRMMQHKAGSAFMLVLIFAISFGAGQIPVYLKHNPAAAASLVRILAYTPPFGAATLLGQALSPAKIASGFAVLFSWGIGLVLALAALDRRPSVVRQKLETTAIKFDSPFDRPASWFGPEDAPLVAHWLRFYVRNNRFRTITLISLPLVGFFTYNFSRPKAGFSSDIFLIALGTFGIATFGTSRFAINQFGYVGGGFRRFFLLPADPAATLRAGSYATLLLGVPLIPLAALGWILLAPVPFDARKVLMLLCSATAGMFFYHSLGLWSSILGPRRGNYYGNLGNDLSLFGNLVMIGGMVFFLSMPHWLRLISPMLVSPDYWWWALAPVLGAALLYRISLRAAGRAFTERREQLMAVLEGRN